MRCRILLLSLCLLLPAGQELNAQNSKEELQQLADRYYDMRLQDRVDNPIWFTVSKLYDRNHDTILILNNRHPGKVTGARAIKGIPFFIGSDRLLTRNSHKAELWNLQTQTGIYYEHVKDMKALKNNGWFVLHYNEEADNKVGMYNTSGKLLQSVDHATRFIIADDDRVYVITKEENGDSHLVRLGDKGKEQLYNSPREIRLLDIYPARQGIMIHEQVPGSRAMGVVYLDLTTKAAYPLQDVLPVSTQQVFTETIEGGNSYFLKVVVDFEKQDTSVVDIWYGNDYRLERKFYPHPVFTYHVWNPVAKQIEQVGADSQAEKASLGNGRYFVSVDRSLLQDYIIASPRLKIDIYDRREETYSLMDTITAHAQTMLYPSPGGEYILYRKGHNWYAYHVATDTKKIIDGNGLHNPYFTPDGKSVLFDGDDGLWCYNPKENSLSKPGNFEGCKVTILNGISQTIAYRFHRKTFDPDKPLLLRLYNRNENKGAYILHRNGRNETLIPFTGMNIKELKHDEDYTHFYYSEENYNLPPRLVYKEPGKDATVLYQSNETDKTILSLKQEIISYTNSDGILLKGILYYPLNYNPSGKYPMVVRIYQIQSHKRNRYPLAEFSTKNRNGPNCQATVGKRVFCLFPRYRLRG